MITASAGTTERQVQDAAKLRDPASWPMWPNLPLKANPTRNVGKRLPRGGWVTADYPTIVLEGKPTMEGILLQLAIEDPTFRGPKGRPWPVTEQQRKLYNENVIIRYIDVESVTDDWCVD